MKLKKILVSNLDVFIYELKMELDNINKDYVMINEDGFCELHIDNFIFFLYDMDKLKLLNNDIDNATQFEKLELLNNDIYAATQFENLELIKKLYSDSNKMMISNTPNLNLSSDSKVLKYSKKGINHTSKKKQMRYENNKYKPKNDKQIKAMFK